MKTIQIQNSGWLPDNDSLMHMQDGINEFIREIHKALLPADEQAFAIISGRRLWGLEMTLSNSDLTLTWTAGALYYNGKVLLVDAGTSNRTNASTHTWIYQEVNAWGQSEYDFVGGPQLDTRLTTTATLVPVANNAIGTRYDAEYFAVMLGGGQVEEPTVSASHFTADSGTWTVSTGNVTRTVQRALNNRVEWDVFVLTSTTASSPTELRVTLPEGDEAARLTSGLAVITGTGITGAETVRYSILPGSTYVALTRMDGSAFPATMSLTMKVSYIAA